MKRILALLLTICMLCTMGIGAFAADGDIVILYTNDVHTYIYEAPATDKNTGEPIPRDWLSYDSIAALKDEIAKTNDVILLDAGDHIQGTAYGAMDKGATIVELMNAAGYNAAAIGNHEFDYGMERALEVFTEKAAYEYLSCNFIDLATDDTVVDSFKIFEMEGKKVAIIGVTTPETFTKSAPAYFQNADGEWIYDFCNDEDGSALYDAVQSAIDAAEAAGADYVIALGHLGIDASSSPWTSREVIANTTGLDAFIDGHSHSNVASEVVKNAAGEDVVLTQTGEKFKNIGKLTISADGTITTELVGFDACPAPKESITEIIEALAAEVDGQLGQKIAESEIDFAYDNTPADSATGNRLVRTMETNLGDFNADAYYYYINEVNKLDCDIAIMNGGGIRANALAGDWTYKTMKNVNTFGNVLCLVNVTGQQILDALEWGARGTMLRPADETDKENQEIGGFLQVSGLTYEIDLDVESTVQFNDKDVWTGAPTGEYRVKNVKVYNKETGVYEPLDLDATYGLGGANYTIRNSGDGFAMFQGAELVLDGLIEDYLVLSEYAKAFEGAIINTENSPLAAYEGYLLNYEDMYGSGRISAHEHELKWVVDEKPTFITEGSGHYECECGYKTESEIIPVIAPSDGEKDEVVIDGRKDDESNPNTGAAVSGIAVLVIAAGAVMASRKK